MSLADFMSIWVLVITLVIFAILFRACGNEASKRTIGEDSSLVIKAEASQQLLDYLRTPIIDDLRVLEKRFNERVGEGRGEGPVAKEILGKSPELIRKKNYGEFIAKLYTIDENERISVFRFVSISMFGIPRERGLGYISVESKNDIIDFEAVLWGTGTPQSPENIASTYIPLYDKRLAKISLFIGPEK